MVNTAYMVAFRSAKERATFAERKATNILLMLLSMILFFSVVPSSFAEDVLVEPGEYVAPRVTLEEGAAPVIWDPDEVGNFNLLDQEGNPVTRESLLGKPWIANFIFARCALQCPATCRKMMEMNEQLKDVDVRFVTITVDPEYDTVEIMKDYAEIWQAKPERWIFMTGEPDEVWRLIREGFKVSAWENVGSKKIQGWNSHTIIIFCISTQKAKYSVRYHSGVDTEVSTLMKVLKGRIETPLKHRPAVIEAAAEMEEQRNAVEQFEAEADPLTKLPAWAKKLPKTNAMLNGLATIMLLVGFFAIKAGRQALHKQMMLYSFAVSIIFLASYLTYHFALHHYAGVRGKPFEGTGTIRTVYFSILISHVILAAIVPILTVTTIVKGLRENWVSHKRWARVTFPIWAVRICDRCYYLLHAL